MILMRAPQLYSDYSYPLHLMNTHRMDAFLIFGQCDDVWTKREKQAWIFI